METRCGYTASDTAFKLNLIANCEGGDGSKAFYSSIEMPDGMTAWQWIHEWPELKQAMITYVGYLDTSK